jgi:hypothetical protein
LVWAARKGEYYDHALNVGNNVYPEVEVKSLCRSTQTHTGRMFNRPATETFTYDADGNLTQDGRWTYTWGGENRLIEMKRDTGSPAGAGQRLVFEYDHQGRRIRKQFYTHNGSNWVLGSDIAFAYDGWNLVAELNAASSNARIRTYLWGLDLSGTGQGAGGVGGLWLVIDYTSGTVYHWPAYDGNGNVAALMAQANGSLGPRYEYGPFGETIRTTGPMAKKKPLRFSTKGGLWGVRVPGRAASGLRGLSRPPPRSPAGHPRSLAHNRCGCGVGFAAVERPMPRARPVSPAELPGRARTAAVTPGSCLGRRDPARPRLACWRAGLMLVWRMGTPHRLHHASMPVRSAAARVSWFSEAVQVLARP